MIYSTLPTNVPFGWQGAEGAYTDPESGFVYLHNRYYAPALGRFLSRDPSGFAGGINLYAYCYDDPLNYGDPLGLDPPGDNPLAGAEDFDSGAQLFHREFSNFANDAQFQPGSPERGDFSSGLHQLPGVGAFLNMVDTLSGKDYIAGTKMSAGGRLLGALGMLPMIGALKPAEIAAGGPAENRIVLGLGEDLENFRKAMNGTSYENGGITGHGFGGSLYNFLTTMENEYNEIHFNLTAPFDSNINPGVAADLGASPLGRGYRNVTNWELDQIRIHPEWWDRIIFWQKAEGGGYTQAPFPFR